MRSNKISSTDLFTNQANINFKKHVKTKSKRSLEIIKSQIDWSSLLIPLEHELSSKRGQSSVGRKPVSLLVIVRCFLLQYMYDLSDPRLEEEIADRRSFQMFLDLNSGDSIPDETTICRYRELFSRYGLDKILFESFNAQLRSRNMLLERVTLVDATIKTAQATPQSGRDKDAAFTKKKNKSYFGYKGHIGVDYGTEVIHSVEFTPANIHDSKEFEKLLHGKEQSVYADKAYPNKKLQDQLVSQGTFWGVLQKGYRNHPLSKENAAKNKQLSTVRNNVERPFAYITRILNYTRCRYYDQKRNKFQFVLTVFTYNIRRMLTLSGA